MTVPGGPDQSRPARFVRTFVLSACTGIAVFVVIALLTASGQAHLFAEGALVCGVGFAVLILVVRFLARLPIGEILGLAVLLSLIDDVFFR
jgi:hypothetical protein